MADDVDAIACPICAARSLVRLQAYPNALHVVPDADELALLGCASCGVLHSHPLPSPHDLETYYRDAYFRSSPYADDAAADRLRGERAAVHVAQYALLARALPVTPDRDDGGVVRALDFGCGVGAWLDALQARGWQTFGLDPGPAGVIAGRRHRRIGELPDSGTFELVLVHHVLEHLLDPRATLQGIRAAMAPTSAIFLSVPDLGRLPEHRRLGYVRNEEHLFSFTRSGLASLLGLTGFDVVAWLDAPDWDRTDPAWSGARLRCLAAPSPTAPELSGRPLEEAMVALARYEDHVPSTTSSAGTS